MTDQRIEELNAIIRRLDEPPLQDAAHRANALKRVYRVFEGNWRSFGKFLEALRDPDIAFPMFDRGDESRLDRTLDEAERLLVNYLASAQALIDHTRRHVRKVYPQGSKLAVQYGRGLELQFTGWSTAEIVKGLRNYMLHRELPLTVAELRIHPEEVEVEIIIPAADLLQWKRWSPTARASLAQLPDGLRVGQLVCDYGRGVADFYRWFGSLQALEELEELKEIDRLQRRRDELIKDLGW